MRFRTLLCALTLLALVLVTGCGAPSLRFDPATQTSVARSNMRRLETEAVVLYYPEHAQEEAHRIAARYQACLRVLHGKARIHSGDADDKPRIVLPDTPLNNAYVAPMSPGNETMGVVPTHETAEVFAQMGLPPDPSFIGCHELVHYVQGLQVTGVPALVNQVFGNVITPQIGLDSWFWEGLAVYYETKLQGGVGRLGSPFWHGLFAASIANHKPNGGYLSDLAREQPFGANYLTGSHFIDYLARTYGEEKLWMVVSHQADSIFFPLGVNPRFGNVYGKNLSDLIDEFAHYVQNKYPVRFRPATQTKVRTLETGARYACDAQGHEAELTSGLDSPTRLVIRDAEGAPVFEENLTDVLPGRRLLEPSATFTSGLSFSGDGKSLYFVAVDQGDIRQEARLVRVDLRARTYEVLFTDLGGPGGSVAQNGPYYYFVRARGDRYDLARFDLRTNTPQVITDFGPRTYPLAPQVSPDGSKLAMTLFDGQNFRIVVVDAETGRYLQEVPTSEDLAGTAPSVNGRTKRWELDVRWQDDTHLLYAAESAGRMQIHRADLEAGTVERLTSAPYLAMAPCASGNRIRFLNREGPSWTLDEIRTGASTPAAIEALPQRGAPESALPTTDEPVSTLSDRAYSRLDHLFVPQLRGVSMRTVNNLGTTAGAAFTGGDRLGLHRWFVSADYNFESKLPSASAAYLMSEFAPWFASAQVDHSEQMVNAFRPYDVPPPTIPTGIKNVPSSPANVPQRETTATATIIRPFYTHQVTLGGMYDQLRLPNVTRIATGPFAEVQFASAESTPYSGARRALLATARIGTYATSGLQDPDAIVDARLQLVGVSPVPFFSRPTFAVSGRARAVRSVEQLLQVGGAGTVTGVFSQDEVANNDGRTPNTPFLLPSMVRFFEPLFGFEDLAVYTAFVAVADARLRVPIVSDVGSASSLWLFPSLFLRGFALEAFGTAAKIDQTGTGNGVASGGAGIARIAVWRIPFDLRFQVARRFTLDPNWVTYFGADTNF